MEVWRQKTSVVSRLKVAGNNLDALAARLRLARLLDAADLHPKDLPPTAIVCVKKLRDPAPRTLRLERSDVSFSLDWQNNLREEIEQLTARAARPIREFVPAQAESVVFADNTELLACLASDWCEGLLAANWWWASLFPNLNTAQSVARIWLEYAQYVPAALELLAQKKKVVKFAARLQPHEAKDLLRRVVSIFGLTKLQTALFAPLSVKRDLSAKAAFATKIYRFAPWQGFVEEAQNESLNFERRILLGVVLMLARSPRIARSAEFAAQIKKWSEKNESKERRVFIIGSEQLIQSKKNWEKPELKIREIYTPPEDKTVDSAVTVAPEEKTVELPPEKASDEKSFPANLERHDAIESEVLTEPTPSEDIENAPKTALTKKSKETFEVFREPKRKAKIRQPKIEPPLFSNETSAKSEAADESLELEITTGFGGVFYLLNLGLYLNLYADFTAPLETGIDLNIWDFVALVGREVAGREIEKDAVWRLLANLSGRGESDEPAKDFAEPDEWRMSSDWLKTFQTGEVWQWTNDGGRLTVYHPAGFCVFDVPAKENALENEMKVYGKDISNLIETAPQTSDSSGRWLTHLINYLRVRLRQALDVETDKEISEILLARRAQVMVTETHLEVFFSLADLPFAVRLSGLDRNPGWIPAAGRFVTFHFV